MCNRCCNTVLKKGEQGLVRKLDCKCWKCEECRPKLAEKWRGRAKAAMSMEIIAGLRWMRTVVDSEKDYDTLLSRLRRHGGVFLRVKLMSQRWHVFFTTTGNGSSTITAAAALAAFSSMVGQPDCIGVTCSECVPKPNSWIKVPSGWNVSALTRSSVNTMNNRLAHRGHSERIRAGVRFDVALIPHILGKTPKVSSPVYSFAPPENRPNRLARTTEPSRPPEEVRPRGAAELNRARWFARVA